jgi:hypothetical protein
MQKQRPHRAFRAAWTTTPVHEETLDISVREEKTGKNAAFCPFVSVGRDRVQGRPNINNNSAAQWLLLFPTRSSRSARIRYFS